MLKNCKVISQEIPRLRFFLYKANVTIYSYLSNLSCGLHPLMSNINYKYAVVIYSILFVTYTHRRVFDLSLSRLLSDYFTVGLITRRYTSTYFLNIKLQRSQWQCWNLEISQRWITVRVALFTSKVVCDISEIKRSLYFVTHLSIK
jgi:hypothetical protein